MAVMQFLTNLNAVLQKIEPPKSTFKAWEQIETLLYCTEWRNVQKTYKKLCDFLTVAISQHMNYVYIQGFSYNNVFEKFESQHRPKLHFFHTPSST